MTKTSGSAWDELGIDEKLLAWAEQRQPWDKDAVTHATALLREAAEYIQQLEKEVRVHV